MKSKHITIVVSEKESVSAILSVPDRFESGVAVVVAHGAGNDMNNPLLVSFCDHLAAAGYLAVRFNFPYKEHGRKAPDRQPLLEDTWRQVLHFIKNKSGYSLRKVFLAGKSMGGRVAAEMLAEGSLTCRWNHFPWLSAPSCRRQRETQRCSFVSDQASYALLRGDSGQSVRPGYFTSCS